MKSLSTYLRSNKKSIQKNKILGDYFSKLHQYKSNSIVKKVVRQLRRIENLSENEMLSLNKKKLRETLSYAYNNTVYYKDLFDKHKISLTDTSHLKNIPLLTKDNIKNNITSMISREYSLEHLGKKNTGGSTGEPLQFYCNTEAGLIDFGHHWYLYSLMGYEKGDTILGCGGIRIPEVQRNKDIFWEKRRKGNVFGDYMFSVLYVNYKNIEAYVKKIIEIRPNILRGYPSFYDRIAIYILENNIYLDFEIKGVNLTAEMCSNEQRINIEKAFKTMVYFEYGHSEVSLYCYTKDNTYTYQSSPIYGYIEVLNDDGSDTEIGEIGNIVVTGFINRGMPFIRYKTGDLGKLSRRNGGVVNLSSIYGRSQDYILSKANEKVYLTALVFGQHLKAFSNIVKWQITQNEIGVIEILIIKGKNYTKSDEIDISEKIQGVTEVEIIFKYVTTIAQTSGGKHLFLKQNVL